MIEDVDFRGDPRSLRAQNFKKPERDSYVISPIDGLDKLSKGFSNCTGLIATGYDKNTNENINISFLSHQKPNYFLGLEANRNRFASDLEQTLMKLKKRCSEGTIDAAIVGGNYAKPKDAKDYLEYQKHYLASIKFLSDETVKVLGFEPIVMTGPKTSMEGENIIYDNKNRRVYIFRPVVGDGSTESFAPNAINDQEKRW